MNQDILYLLITQTWQVTLLIVIVWSTTRLFAKDRPHLAHILWALVLIKCLTPPLWSSPASAFSWMGSDDVSAVSPAVVVVPPQKSSIDERSFLDPIIVHAVRQTDDANTNSSSALVSGTATTTPTVSPDKFATDWSKTLSLIWIVGAGMGISVTTIRFLLFLGWIRRSQTSAETNDPAFDQAVQVLAKRLGIRRRVHVKILTSPVGPAVLGLLRPTILLPASIVNGKTPKQLEPLMAHELIHIRRGDLWWGMIQTIAKSLFWFHPMVWFAAKMLTRESERSCDEETVACLGCRPSTYAKGLIEVLEHKHRLRVAPALPGVRPVDITSARLERVMNLGNGIHRRTPVWAWLILVGGCVAVLPGAALVFGQESTTPSAQNPKLPETTLPTTDTTKIPFLENLPVIGYIFQAHPNKTASPATTSTLPPEQFLQPPIGLPQVGATHSHSNEAIWRVETYVVGDLIVNLQNWKDSRPAGEQHLMVDLPVMLGCRDVGPDGKSSTPNGKQVEIATRNGTITLGNQWPTMQLTGNCLCVFGTDSDHEELKRQIQRFRKYGFRHVVVETRILRMPNDRLQGFGIEWSVAPIDANGVIDETAMASDSYDPRNMNDFSTFLMGSDWPPYFGANHNLDANHIPKSTERPQIAAASFIEKNAPVSYAMVDQEEVLSIISMAKGDSETTLYMAPSVVMHNGQNASIVNGTQRPFVVGLNRVEDKTNDTFTLQPVIRVINEGIVLNLNAKIIEGDGVNLACRLECSTILSVDTVELPIKDAHQAPARVQVPEVATTRIQSTLAVPAGKTLVLSCVQKTDDGDSELFLALLTCYLPDSENPDARRQAKTTTPPAQPEPVEIVDDDGELNLVPVTPGSNKPAPPTQFNIRSAEPGKRNIDYQPLIEALESFDFATTVEGDVEFDINHSLPTIRGKNLCIHTDDQQFRLSGDHGEMKVLSKDHFIFQFAGNVEYEMGNGTSFRADELTFDPTIGFQLQGSVSMKVDEGGDAKRECSADRIRIDLEKQTLTLLGNARYIRDGNHRSDIQAEFIEVNLSNDEIRSSNSIKETDDIDLFNFHMGIKK